MCLRTDIFAPTDHAGILASPVASNPSFLPPQPLSAASLQPLLRLASLLRLANGGPVYSLIAGSRESEAPLNGCHRQRGDASRRGLLCCRLGPAGCCLSAGRGARGRGRLAPARERMRRAQGGGRAGEHREGGGGGLQGGNKYF